MSHITSTNTKKNYMYRMHIRHNRQQQIKWDILKMDSVIDEHDLTIFDIR